MLTNKLSHLYEEFPSTCKNTVLSKEIVHPLQVGNTHLASSHTQITVSFWIQVCIYMLPLYHANTWDIEPWSVLVLLTVCLEPSFCFSAESIYGEGEGQQEHCFLPQHSEDLWSEIQRGATPVLLLSEIWAPFFSWISSIALKIREAQIPLHSTLRLGFMLQM